MAAALLLHAPEERPELGWGCWLRETLGTIADCRHDVAAGARWDQARWDRANTLSLLPDVADCAAAEAELRGLLTAGRVPADLIAAAEQALGQASS